MTVTFMNAWNNYLWPTIILQDSKAITMPMLVANLKSGYSVDYGMLMLGVLICTLPTAIIFLCLQKSFANGIRSSEIMQQKMPKQETMTQAHIRKAQGAFLLAHRMGLIEDPTMEGLETRRQKHNEELRRMEQEGQRFYGPMTPRTGVSAI